MLIVKKEEANMAPASVLVEPLELALSAVDDQKLSPKSTAHDLYALDKPSTKSPMRRKSSDLSDSSNDKDRRRSSTTTSRRSNNSFDAEKDKRLLKTSSSAPSINLIGHSGSSKTEKKRTSKLSAMGMLTVPTGGSGSEEFTLKRSKSGRMGRSVSSSGLKKLPSREKPVGSKRSSRRSTSFGEKSSSSNNSNNMGRSTSTTSLALKEMRAIGRQQSSNGLKSVGSSSSNHLKSSGSSNKLKQVRSSSNRLRASVSFNHGIDSRANETMVPSKRSSLSGQPKVTKNKFDSFLTPAARKDLLLQLKREQESKASAVGRQKKKSTQSLY